MNVRRKALWVGIGCTTAVVGTLAALQAARRDGTRLALPSVAAIGANAPDFDLADYDGRRWRLPDLRGRRVLLSFFCGCKACEELGRDWQGVHQTRPNVAVIGIASLAPAGIRVFKQSTGATFALLFDPGYETASRYKALQCPRSWVIDEEGVLIYTSGPRDSRSGVVEALRKYLPAPPSQG